MQLVFVFSLFQFMCVLMMSSCAVESSKVHNKYSINSQNMLPCLHNAFGFVLLLFFCHFPFIIHILSKHAAPTLPVILLTASWRAVLHSNSIRICLSFYFLIGATFFEHLLIKKDQIPLEDETLLMK